MSSRVTINIRSTTLNITNPIVQNITYDTNNTDFTLIKDRLITLPNLIDQDTLKSMNMTLENGGKLLETKAGHGLIQTWKEVAYNWLQYLGYGSLGLMTLLILHKIGVFAVIIDLLKKLRGNCYSNCSFGNRGTTTYRQEVIPMNQANIEVPRDVTPRSLRF